MQGGNNLSGTVPVVTTGSALSLLYLDHNQLTGTFPLLLTAPLMHVMDLSNNNFTGPLVIQDSSYTTTEAGTDFTTRYLGLEAQYGCSLALLFSNNQMTGTLPPWLASLPITVGTLGALLASFCFSLYVLRKLDLLTLAVKPQPVFLNLLINASELGKCHAVD